jgi:hypothetical protein
MKIAHPKTNITRTFAKLCFDFIRDIVTIELGFRQQVAAEVLKNIPKLSFRCKSRDVALVPGSFAVTKSNISQQGALRESLHETRSHRYSHSGSNPNNSPVPRFSIQPARTHHPNRHQHPQCSRWQPVTNLLSRKFRSTRNPILPTSGIVP